jgi:hypothetical protein
LGVGGWGLGVGLEQKSGLCITLLLLVKNKYAELLPITSEK